MKRDVGGGVFIKVVEHLMPFAESLEERAQGGDAFITCMKRDQAGRHTFERCPGLDHFDDLALRPAHHHDASTRQHLQKSLLLQHSYSFANGRTADTEALRQLAFVEHDRLGLAINVHVDDRLLQSGISLSLKTDFFRKASDDKFAFLSRRLAI